MRGGRVCGTETWPGQFIRNGVKESDICASLRQFDIGEMEDLCLLLSLGNSDSFQLFCYGC